MYYFFGALLLIIAFLLIFFYLRKMRIINRINGMSICENYQNGTRIAGRSNIHWWHTIFSLGQFSKPDDLTLEVTIYFPDTEMKNSFVDSLLYTGPGLERMKVYHNRVSLLFVSSILSLPAAIYQHMIHEG